LGLRQLSQAADICKVCEQHPCQIAGDNSTVAIEVQAVVGMSLPEVKEMDDAAEGRVQEGRATRAQAHVVIPVNLSGGRWRAVGTLC
jgi:hypothetical protein